MPNSFLEQEQWQMRFVRDDVVDPQKLLKNPDNARIHGELQQGIIRASLKKYGWLQRILVNVNTDFIVDGHARLDEALKAGQKLVPVTYIDITKEEELELLAFYDASGDLADLNNDKMSSILSSIPELNNPLDELAAIIETKITIPGFDDEDEDEESGTMVMSGTVDFGGEVIEPPTAKEKGDGDAGLRPIQVYLEEEDYPVFMNHLKTLSAYFSTQNNTDTIRRAVEFTISKTAESRKKLLLD